ncbi:hypothetical protein KGQ20_24540 [Catenulispora sp. NF23]|uniref:hypothetical protein n=1 Tax=Catenulispora pinistramenti TaxID=2705254 RepID=UPI001BA9E117|nr:hypothetical protein [Catenulispora pinistramenti]MBS2535936.1 hypothetical protein [Catenulispora pinistramenti]
MTTWRELAELLRDATSTPAAASTDTGYENGDAESVNSLADLRSYLHRLIEDFRLDVAEVASRDPVQLRKMKSQWNEPGEGAMGTYAGFSTLRCGGR